MGKKSKRQREGDDDNKTSCLGQLQSHLKGSVFRQLNETLYTQDSTTSLNMFRQDPTLYDAYHNGYTEQRSQWPHDPLQDIANHIETRLTTVDESLVIADIGCGTGRLAKMLLEDKNITSSLVVHSFDLVAPNPRVTVADMASLPLESQTVDIAIFCLSLMATNYLDGLLEAIRVLKPGGELHIVEVTSRIPSIRAFKTFLQALGVGQVKVGFLGGDDEKAYFVYFRGTTGGGKQKPTSNKHNGVNVADIKRRFDVTKLLLPCSHKRR
eukprot:PhF_6_TR26980/c0_g1_i1/m.39373/K14850/RRP8; ribosomal RNA-processing protein 8